MNYRFDMLLFASNSALLASNLSVTYNGQENASIGLSGCVYRTTAQ
jgi:hypothetical protein